MSRTNPRRIGPLREEQIILNQTDDDFNPVTDPTEEGGVTYHDGSFAMRDASGVFDPRTGGSGLTEADHKKLRHLIHFIDDGPADGFLSGAYKEILPVANPFPTSVIWWESNAKLKKIVEKSIDYSGGIATPTPIVWEMFNSDGLIVARVTDSITYQGVFEVSRERTIEVVGYKSAGLDMSIT